MQPDSRLAMHSRILRGWIKVYVIFIYLTFSLLLWRRKRISKNNYTNILFKHPRDIGDHQKGIVIKEMDMDLKNGQELFLYSNTQIQNN